MSKPSPVISEDQEKLTEALANVKVQSFHMQCSLDKGNRLVFSSAMDCR